MPKIVKFHGRGVQDGDSYLALSTDDNDWLKSLPGFIGWMSFSPEMMMSVGKDSDEKKAELRFLGTAASYAGAVPIEQLDCHFQRATADGKIWIAIFGKLVFEGDQDQWLPPHWVRDPACDNAFCVPKHEMPMYSDAADKASTTPVTKPRSEMSFYELRLEESRQKTREEDAARPANCGTEFL